MFNFSLNTLFLIFLSFSLISCSSSSSKQHPRRSLSSEVDLSGTYLGYSKYGIFKMPATRIYVQKDSHRDKAYYLVVAEYHPGVKIAPQYISSKLGEGVKKITGHLKTIIKRTSVYHLVPTTSSKQYILYPLQVKDGSIVAKKVDRPSRLYLKNKNNFKSAFISKSKNGEPAKLHFPANLDLRPPEYLAMVGVYSAANLKSTWRKNLLPGPYLSAYARLDDTVLNLERPDEASFVINPNYRHLSKLERERMFTNKKSAFISGDFRVTEPINGMFIFTPEGNDHQNQHILKSRIGLFIDFFDNTAGGEDVVELVLVDPSQPEDLLMYYEHPDNGEGI